MATDQCITLTKSEFDRWDSDESLRSRVIARAKRLNGGRGGRVYAPIGHRVVVTVRHRTPEEIADGAGKFGVS